MLLVAGWNLTCMCKDVGASLVLFVVSLSFVVLDLLSLKFHWTRFYLLGWWLTQNESSNSFHSLKEAGNGLPDLSFIPVFLMSDLKASRFPLEFILHHSSHLNFPSSSSFYVTSHFITHHPSPWSISSYSWPSPRPSGLRASNVLPSLGPYQSRSYGIKMPCLFSYQRGNMW